MRKIMIGLLVLAALLLVNGLATAQDDMMRAVDSADVDVMSDGQAYESYLAAPDRGRPLPWHRPDSLVQRAARRLPHHD